VKEIDLVTLSIHVKNVRDTIVKLALKVMDDESKINSLRITLRDLKFAMLAAAIKASAAAKKYLIY